MNHVMKHSAIWLTTGVRLTYHAMLASTPRKRLRFLENAISALEVAREMLSSQLGSSEQDEDRRVA